MHNGSGSGAAVWVSWAGGVYDVTNFLEEHPGGKSKIVLAAGQALEPFWALYGGTPSPLEAPLTPLAHQTEHVRALLERHRIGNLSPPLPGVAPPPSTDPFALDPPRHPGLVVRSARPFNAETPLPVLGDEITPTELFYVRNHLPVPQVHLEDWRLRLTRPDGTEVALTLADLQAYPPHTITATLQCAGNRRNEMSEARPGVRGGPWETGALSTATWTGVRLRDVLLAQGVDEQEAVLRHVHFEGLDRDADKAYGASIPLSAALDPYPPPPLTFPPLSP